ncbi:glycosyl transferase family 1 [Dyadobacter luteus]|uniref:Glycosyl transferase family 1 n=1 Tax=Dyadobacter luteus TaxID=2259619 RepID=A0A3D8YI85_9BACT|nr:glycosyltransferase [Dyadobacter luteus]REA64543.1 glycosyl transferase family 1 [Dyadobacter luteus]
MNPDNGGPCQGIRNTIPELQRIGISNEVVCFDNSSESYLKHDLFKIHALGASKGSWKYNSSFDEWLIQNVEKYDLVIVHGLWLYHSYMAVKILRKLKQKNKRIPPVYIMPHGMLDPWFQRDKTRKLKALRNEVYWHLIEKKVVNSVNGLLFTCEQELLLARETFTGYNPRMELNVGYGIQPPPSFSQEMKAAFRMRADKLGDKPYILFLSRLHPKKGLDLLINSYIKLGLDTEDFPDLVVAGPVEGEYANILRSSARKAKNIHFVGMLQGDAKWGAFYGCQAFVLPSHQENFGISVAEALACSRPVLITDQVNIWKEISYGGAGIVDSDTLDGIERLLAAWFNKTDEDKISMSDNAYAVYRKHFAVEQAAQRLKDVLLKETRYA